MTRGWHLISPVQFGFKLAAVCKFFEKGLFSGSQNIYKIATITPAINGWNNIVL